MIEINRKGSYQLVPFPEKLKHIDIGDFYGDFSKIQNETGWFPRTSIYDGLNSTISYFRQNLEKYR